MIFIFPLDPTERDYKRYNYFNYFDEIEFVGFINASNIFKKIHYNDTNNKYSNFTLRANTLFELISLLWKSKPTHIFNCAGRSGLKQIITKFFYLRIIHYFSEVIEYVGPNVPHDIHLPKVKNECISLLKKKIIFGQPDYSYITGLISESRSQSKNKIYGHSLDYDQIVQKNHFQQQSNTIVFIDSNFVFHPDFNFHGRQPPCSKEKYFDEVNYFLSNVSKKFKSNVVIQLHPTSDTKICSELYDFPISNQSSYDAIATSSIVVGHSSTVLSIAVILNKPIILFQTSELIVNTHYTHYTLNFSKELNCSNYEWCIDANMIDDPVVCSYNYKNYITNYVKHPYSTEDLSYKILINSLSKLY